MKNLNLLIRKCKSLSRQLGRSSSYKSGHLRYSRSSREGSWTHIADDDCGGGGGGGGGETVYVGSSRRRYVIKSKYLSHPLINALIEKSGQDANAAAEDQPRLDRISIKCEVVLFDHLLWILDNGDPNNLCSDLSLEELVELYML